MPPLIIRLRSNLGLHRITLPTTTSSSSSSSLPPSALYDQIAAQLSNPELTTPLSLTPFRQGETGKFINPDDSFDLLSKPYSLKNGDMLYCFFKEGTIIPPPAPLQDGTNKIAAVSANSAPSVSSKKLTINKDGSITQSSSFDANSGFRPGLLPLRAMKMHWTLAEFVRMNDSFQYKIQRQPTAYCLRVSVEGSVANEFQSSILQSNFKTQRFGYLYGTYDTVKASEIDSRFNTGGSGMNNQGVKSESTTTDVSDQGVKVQFIYEPPQVGTINSFERVESIEAERELERVERLCGEMGMFKVGWIVSVPPREKGFVFSCGEVIMAAELQCMAEAEEKERRKATRGAGSKESDDDYHTPFVTIRVSLDEKTGTGTTFDAFQVSQQCQAMAAEGALQLSGKPGFVTVEDTFTALVEGKESKTIENSFFLTLVPIIQHEDKRFTSFFPPVNRFGGQTSTDLKDALSRVGKDGWTFEGCILDFQLLLYLGRKMGEDEVINVVKQVMGGGKEKMGKVDEGWVLMVMSIAGVEGRY